MEMWLNCTRRSGAGSHKSSFHVLPLWVRSPCLARNLAMSATGQTRDNLPWQETARCGQTGLADVPSSHALMIAQMMSAGPPRANQVRLRERSFPE